MIATLERALGWLADAPPPALLVARATAVLAAAWLADRALARRNPRWRVLTWRAAALGLAALVALAALPPILEWRVAPPSPAAPPAIASATIPAEAPAAPIPPDDPPGLADAFLAEPPAEVPLATAEPAKVEPRPAPVVPTPTGPSRPPIALASWLLAAWLAGVVLFGMRLAVGARRLARVVRRAGPAPGAAAEACRATAARLGVARPVRVVLTPELASPCLTGVVRPVVLLPKGAGLDALGPDLEAVLIHELTHVRNRDLAWNDALHLASIALWFHPLAWRARAAHAAACDAVCDATAVDQLGDVAAYGRALARLALKASGPVPARGLAMARACDVRRRVAALQRMVHRAPLPRRLVMPAILLSAALVALIGGTAVLRAHDEPPAGAVAVADEAKVKTLTVLVRDAETGGLLQGAVVKSRSFAVGAARWEEREAVTGPDGAATVEYPAATPIASLLVTVRQAGRVPAGFSWSGERRPIQVPDRKVIRLAKGTTIGGVVTDASGRPIEGAEVDLSLPMTESDLGSHVMSLGAPKTDAEGRWRIDEAPADLQAIGVRVEHPRYRPAFGVLARGLDGVTAVLTRGLSVPGTVRDAGGKPVVGARVVYLAVWSSTLREARTGEEGDYVLENCGEGPASILVQAEGHAPQDRPIQLAAGEEPKPQDFTLEAPSTLRVRVVDVSGRPVENAYVAVDRWHDSQALEFRARTDAEGRAVWREAPKDPVLFDVFLGGFMRTRQAPLTADEAEHVVVLRPALTISGRVTDAETGRPIPSFTVFQGRTENDRSGVNWRRDEPAACSDGRFVQMMDFPARSHHLLIEAPGYKPAESRAFRSDEGATTQDFALERQAGVEGVVLLPDGRPAEGAEVVLITDEVHAFLKGDAFDRTLETPVVRTGPDGRFAFPKPGGESLLVAAASEGFATATPEAGGADTLRLAPWGRIEGRVRVGAKPGASETMTFAPDLAHRSGLLSRLDVTPEILADAEGRFVFDKLPPWPGYVGRTIVTDLSGGGRSLTPSGLTPVAVESGKTVAVEVGGGGRPVVGRFVLDGPAPARIDWRINEPVKLKPVVADDAQARPDPWQCYAANLDEAGRFRVEDVPPGTYRLDLPLNGLPDTDPRHAAATIGRATLSVVVPEGDRAQPVDLGDVTVNLNARRAQAAPAPGAPAAKGMTVRVLDAETGGPLQGVKVELSHFGERAEAATRVEAETRDDGEARLTFPETGPLRELRLTLRKPGYVPVHLVSSSQRRDLEPPEAREVRLTRGRSIGGGVVDEAGGPVAGAVVVVSGPATEADSGGQVFTMGEARTDAEGRWTFAEAPADPARLSARIQHPDHAPVARQELAPSGETRTVLRKGATVRGRATGPDGRPVAGARVDLLRDRPMGEDPETRTDAAGGFAVEHFEPTPAAVLVVAPGFAPGLREVAFEVDGTSAPVDVALEPGAALRLRVVDRDGRPVAGAGVGVETWRGRRILSLWRAKTDAEGLAAWVDAPRDELRLSFYRAGSMSLRDVPVRASDEVHQVVLHPELVIAGKVVDAGTGEPIPKFRVIRGMYFPNQGEPAWQRGEAVDRTDGRYRERFSEPYEGWAVRIEAPGYKTAASRRFRPDEGAVVQDFALEPQAPFEGVVLRPDGAPAQGAEVVLAGPRDLLALEGRAIRRGPGTSSALAGPDGRFSTTRPDGAFRLVVASEHGYADVTSEQFAASKTIRLAPWGRVEGVLRLGGRPAAGETATLHLGRMGLFPRGLEAKADAEGRFVFRDVPPGPARIGRTIVTPSERGGRFATTTDSAAVEVAPGATTAVVVGGTGRPVVGRIVVEGPGDRPIDWGASRPVELVAETAEAPRPPEPGAGRPRPPARFAGLVDKDGRFRVENVPPGAYRLQLPSNELLENRPLGEPPAISVPEGDRDQPVDLGDVTVKLDGPPKAEAAGPKPALEGVLLRPDGKPAWGARVMLLEEGKVAGLDGRAIEAGDGTPSAEVRGDGRFSLPRPAGDFRLVVASNHGYAETTVREFAESATIRLAAWGRVEGVLRIGGRPAAGETAYLHRTRAAATSPIQKATADAEGRFVFEDVPPGPAMVGRLVVTHPEGGEIASTPTDPTPVDVAPGTSTKVVVGDRGRPVIGRLVVDHAGDGANLWRGSRPVVLIEAAETRGPGLPSRFAGPIDEGGRFRIENVPPGAYGLQFPPNKVRSTEVVRVTVPAGDRDVPVDLGDVTDGPRGAEAAPERDEPAKTITVRVLDAETGGPLEGVRVEARSTPPGDGTWRGEATGGDGVARVGYRDDAPIKNFDLRVTKPGRVPAYVRLTDDRRPIELPASREFRLERGTTMGGVVTDESGAPVEGATVSVTMPMTELEAAVSNVWFPIAEAKTDARGRWRIDEAPADLGRVRVGVRHPRHLAASGESSRDLDAVTAVLRKGQTVRGRVRGPDGAPIGGASVVVGDFFESNGPRGTTDAGGAFAIDRCRPGPTAVTVQAEGFAPQDRLIDVPEPGAEAPPLDFVLELGVTLRLRVVDDAGRPVEGAYATVMGWHGRNGLRFMAKTDADGRVVWTSAPRDPISFQAGKDGYLAAEKLSLTASDEEHVFVLHPELKVVGRVTDAETGRPIPKFSVFQGLTVPGRTGVSWDLMQPLGGVEGRYVYKSAVPAMGHHLLIEAPGYKPAESRAIRPDEGEVVQDFALERRPAIEGVVLRPDGRPAWGADVAIVADETGRRAGPRAWGEPVSPPAPFSLRGHTLQRRTQGSVVRVGPEGRFSFPRPEGEFLIVAATAVGFAEATAEDFARSGTLQLAPWGRIEGVLKVGDAPVANGRAFYVPTLPRRFGLSKGIIRSKEVQADAEGRFAIDELPPWPGRVGRLMVTARPAHGLSKEPDPPTIQTAVGLVPVEVRPGETTRVEVGGRGRAVVGRIVVDGPGEAAVDWRLNRPVVLVPEHRGPQGPPDGASIDRASQFGGTIDADGRFRVDDVAPGAYQLRVLVDGRPPESPPRRPEEIGRATLSVEVPDGERARPVDVGDVKVRLESFLEIGGEAPALDLPRLDDPDGRFVLADRRGKLVLLTFWSAASQESRREMEEIKRLREAFGNHPRFAIAGVSCDAAPEEAARHAESHGLDWTQAFAGPTGSGPAQAYRVDRLPTTFLIDADGRIILWDEEAGALKGIIHKRLVELGN